MSLHERLMRAVLIGLAFLMQGQTIPANSADWKTQIEAKLVGLSATEKKSVLLCVRGGISVNYRDTVAQSLQKGGNDTVWALKISGFENVQMAELAKAASWPDMQTYYEAETRAVRRLIEGKLDWDGYENASRQNEAALKRIFDTDTTGQDEHKRNFQTFEAICKDISSGFIVRAKASASSD